jgi:hypothetical protein
MAAEEAVVYRDHLIRVTNNHDDPEWEVVKGRFAGRDYKFKKGMPLDIPVAAAEHIFGFGKDEEFRMRVSFNGLGIQHRLGSYERCQEWIKKISFSDPPALVELAPDDPRGKRRKSTVAHPSVTGGGKADAGGDLSASDDPNEGGDDII